MIQSVPHPSFHAGQHPDKMALVMAETGLGISYRELADNSNRAAGLFQALGCREGDTIAIMLENQLRYPELCWAAKNAGLHYVCIGKQLNAAEAAYVVSDSGAKVFISSSKLQATACEMVGLLKHKPALLMLDGNVGPFESYEAGLAGQPPLPPRPGRRGNSMLYSSGTTGLPKGVRVALTDEPPEQPPKRYAFLVSDYELGTGTVFLNPGPFYHVAPLRLMMSVQRAGGTVIGFEKFDAESALRAIDQYGVNTAFLVPTMFIRMLGLPADVRAKYRMSTLRHVVHGAAPCPVHVKEAMIAWWGPVIQELYGGTEGIGTTSINSPEWLTHKGSVGRPSHGTELHILDDGGEECATGVPGLIYLWNGRPVEYLNDPAKTLEARHPKGWMTLGDIGYLDDEGYLYLTDRQSNMIISGGVNIYPQESENVLLQHPDVADVAVIGVPHPEYGEEVKAVVHPSSPVDDPAHFSAALISYCRERLSSAKCPRSVDISIAPLPRSDTGKLLKKDIRKRYWGDGNQLV
jgi:long-chain acyl-CoA synthetase